MRCHAVRGARVGQRWRGEDQTEVVAIATVLTPVWNNIRENDASREGIRQVSGD